MGLVVGLNSYFDVTGADEIVHSRLPTFDEGRKFWDSLKEEDKEIIILNAMDKIDLDKMLYVGKKVNRDNKLQFPRIYHGDTIECPESIKIAIILQAIHDFKDYDNELHQLVEELARDDVSSYKVEGSSITIDKSKAGKHINNEGVSIDIYNKYIIQHTICC